ncbi:hypothetical protein H920_12735 [Fukomys damarensis]|uniref:Uncharacterized protein n=1 Tax=Fukomys damarensis TaxID=885580 RepID=A0A091D466_FUKDA|nr:hypothetical protein H920_12735 [Fukomys damarensis]
MPVMWEADRGQLGGEGIRLIRPLERSPGARFRGNGTDGYLLHRCLPLTRKSAWEAWFWGKRCWLWTGPDTTPPLPGQPRRSSVSLLTAAALPDTHHDVSHEGALGLLCADFTLVANLLSEKAVRLE